MDDDSRPPEQLRRHYEVERELADRLRRSSRAERTQLFRTLYNELFTRVPDHPRLTRRDTPEESRRAVEARMKLLRGHLAGVKTFLEFAPGDCRLAFEVCRHVERVFAVDISDQAGGMKEIPPNFKLILYDGYQLDVPDSSVDLAFSYQFIEHLHPDDVEPHFQTIKRVLRPGGAYIFDTPHAFTGPHDISCFFSETPQGFHLKEWTYGEMTDLLRRAGFPSACAYRRGKIRRGGAINFLNRAVESALAVLPYKLRKTLSRRLFVGVTMLAQK
jgi:SAM-dependent methyltransferase